jgi:DNA-binding phage protein
MSAEKALRGVQQAARHRREAVEARRSATDELRRYCKEAQREGVPMTRIASEAGLSRQGLYDLLAEPPSA